MKILGLRIRERDPDDDMDPDERDALLQSMVADSLAYAQGREPNSKAKPEPTADPPETPAAN